MFEKFIGYGECTEKRNLPHKGGAFGNKKKRCRELVDITAKEIKDGRIWSRHSGQRPCT